MEDADGLFPEVGDRLRGIDAVLLYAQGALVTWIVHLCSRVYGALGTGGVVSVGPCGEHGMCLDCARS